MLLLPIYLLVIWSQLVHSAVVTVTQTILPPSPTVSTTPDSGVVTGDLVSLATTTDDGDDEPLITEPPHVPDPCDVFVVGSDSETRYQYTCQEGKSCAFDGALGIFGCFSTSQLASSDVFDSVTGHEMFTSCMPVAPNVNCGMTCSDTTQVTTCNPTGFTDDLSSTFCGTKLLISSTVTLSQFYCAATQSATSSILWPSGSPLPFREVTVPPADPPRPTESSFTLPQGSDLPAASIIGVSVGVMAGLAGAATLAVWAVGRLQKKSKRNSRAAMITAANKPVPSTFQKIGRVGAVTTAISTVYIVAAPVFLLLFWRSPQQENAPLLRSWILDNNLTRIVTVSALVIRLSTGVQMTMAMSMIAAIALEKVLVPLAEAPSWLLQRSGAGSGLDMMILASRRLLVTRDRRAVGIAVLVVLLSLIDLGLQFSSTLLISDLATQSVKGRANITDVSVAFTQLLGGDRSDSLPYAIAPPTTYPPFAEFRDEAMPPVANGVDYTGGLRRALFPFDTEADRLSLLSYSGWVTVIDATFACIAPSLADFHMNGTNQTGHNGVTQTTGFDLYFTIDADQMSQVLNNSIYNTDYFVTTDDNNSSIAVEHCSFWGYPMLTGRDTGWGTQLCLPQKGGSNMVVLNLTAGDSTERADLSLTNEWPKPRNLSDFVIGTDGAWTTLAWRDVPGWSWSVSVCSSPLEDPLLIPVNFSTAGPLAAQRVQIDANKDFDVTNLMDWLGFSLSDHGNGTANGTTIGDSSSLFRSVSLQDRGLATLQNRTNWTQPDFQGGFDAPLVQDFTSLVGNVANIDDIDAPNDNPNTFTIQPFSQSLPELQLSAVYPVYSALLQRVLQATNRPALAVQSFWTLVYAAYYYDSLPAFDIRAPAAVARWEDTLVPARWTGFAVVLLLLVLHVGLVGMVAAIFLRRTRFSRLQEPWDTFMQGSEGAVGAAIAGARKNSYKKAGGGGGDVKKMLEVRGEADLLVGLLRGRFDAGDGDGVGVYEDGHETEGVIRSRTLGIRRRSLLVT